MENFKVVYRIVGRHHCMEKPIILAGGLGHPLKTLDDAKRTMNEIIERNKRDVMRGKRVDSCGLISIESEMTPDWLLEDVKIQSRKVTPWIDETI